MRCAMELWVAGLRSGCIGEAGNIMLQVADDGPGVASADRARLGARFQRFASQSVEVVGIGLSIVQRIADLHGAKLTFGDGLEGCGL